MKVNFYCKIEINKCSIVKQKRKKKEEEKHTQTGGPGIDVLCIMLYHTSNFYNGFRLSDS